MKTLLFCGKKVNVYVAHTLLEKTSMTFSLRYPVVGRLVRDIIRNFAFMFTVSTLLQLFVFDRSGLHDNAWILGQVEIALYYMIVYTLVDRATKGFSRQPGMQSLIGSFRRVHDN